MYIYMDIGQLQSFMTGIVGCLENLLIHRNYAIPCL